MKRTEIQELLPGIILRAVRPDNPLGAVLSVMEGMLDPSDTILSSIDSAFDPRRAIDPMVPFLARWIDLDWLLAEAQRQDPSSPVAAQETIINGFGRLRELIANAAHLAKWRGTSSGLLLFLRMAIGVGSIDIDERPVDKNGIPIPFHIRVLVRGDALQFKPAIIKILDREKPAYLTYELVSDS